jgi:predicted MFS family arabinose efflux permease
VTWLDRYRSVLRDGGVAPAFVASLVGRLSLGMTSLAILLLVRQSSGSYASAGLVSAAYALAFAVGAPSRARSADRRGPVPVMLRCSVIQPLALVCLAILAEREWPVGVLIIPAVVAGLFVPPLGPVMRALWAARLPVLSLPTAYALESVLVEVCFVAGPALVAGLTVTAGPAAALIASAVVSMVGGLGMAISRGVQSVRPHEAVERGRAGPLASPAVRTLLLTMVWVGAGFGAVEVAMPAFAEETGSRPATAGILLAVWSAGSMLGGLVYGGMTNPRPHTTQMRVLVTALAIGSALPLLAPGPVSMGVGLVLYGTTIAPFMACNSILLGAAAPRGTTTEAFAWSSSMIFAGIGIGTSVAGAVIDHSGATAGLVVTAVAGALTLLVSVSRRRTLVPAVQES